MTELIINELRKINVNTVIIIAFAADLILWVICFSTAVWIKNRVYPKCNLQYGYIPSEGLDSKQKSKISSASNIVSKFYAWYVNVTAVFPLLGILGTVQSLMGMGTDNLQEEFGYALVTTFLGLVCAIFFKIMDSVISPKIDNAVEIADYFLRRSEYVESNSAEGECDEKQT